MRRKFNEVRIVFNAVSDPSQEVPIMSIGGNEMNYTQWAVIKRVATLSKCTVPYLAIVSTNS